MKYDTIEISSQSDPTQRSQLRRRGSKEARGRRRWGADGGSILRLWWSRDLPTFCRVRRSRRMHGRITKAEGDEGMENKRQEGDGDEEIGGEGARKIGGWGK